MRKRQYWKEEGEKTCRICEEGEEDIKYVLRECHTTKGHMRDEEFLNERGIDLPIMYKVVDEKARKRKEVKMCNSGEAKKPKTLQRCRY